MLNMILIIENVDDNNYLNKYSKKKCYWLK